MGCSTAAVRTIHEFTRNDTNEQVATTLGSESLSMGQVGGVSPRICDGFVSILRFILQRFGAHVNVPGNQQNQSISGGIA
jgi:hypothetical protein